MALVGRKKSPSDDGLECGAENPGQRHSATLHGAGRGFYEKEGGELMQKNGLCSAADYGTRYKRRNAVKIILACLTEIRDAEQNCLDNTPENFQCSESFEDGECAVDALDDIIDLLNGVY